MKHISIRRIGKKLMAISMAAVASVTMMLAAAPTASAESSTVYTPNDNFISLPAPIYNWKNSNKVLKFKVKKGTSGARGDAMRLMDGRGNYRTNFIRYTFPGSGVASICTGGTMAPILYSGGWYEVIIPVKNLNTFPYPQNSAEYLSSSQSGCQTLYYIENRGYYYKEFEIIENVDPDRSVSRFHVNKLNLSMNDKNDIIPNDPYHHYGDDSVAMWKYSNKKISFDFKPTNAHNYGSDKFTVYLQTITETGSWKGIANSITVNVVTGACTLPGATVTTLSNGWTHIDLPLNKFTVRNDQITNAATRTLDVVGFDWVNHSFEMRNFKVA